MARTSQSHRSRAGTISAGAGCTGLADLHRFRQAIDASGEAIFMTDCGGTISFVNRAFTHLYGYAAREIVGRTTPRILKSGKTSPDVYASLWADLLAGRSVERLFVNRRRDGCLVHVQSSASPIRGERGEVVGYVSIQRDVTDAIRAELALRDSEEQYRTLAEAARDSIFIVSDDGELEYANSAALAKLRPLGIDVHVSLADRPFPEAEVDRQRAEIAQVLATGQPLFVDRLVEYSADCERWEGVWLVPMTRGSGRRSVMAIARDTTETKRLEEQLRQAQKMEAVGQLAGGIAHDFNNVLTAVIGYADLVLTAVRDQPEIQADVEEIKSAGERAARLTNQLLAFSRKQMISPRVLNLNGVLVDLSKMLGRVLGEDVHLVFTTAPELKPIKADPGQLEQVLLNLAVNARDAMSHGGTLGLTTGNATLDTQFCRRHPGAVAGDYVSLTVSDTGSGMSHEVLSRIFEPFFTTKGSRGTGLGLATVYGIVKQNGGYIHVDSVPGEGTTFSLYFPVVSETVEDGTAPLRVTGGKEITATVLLAEDDGAIRELVGRTLQQRGYTVLQAAQAGEALEMAAEYPDAIHLLVTDIVMPDLNGRELAAQLRQFRPDVKVLYVTGYFAHPATEILELSASERFLEKPFSADALLAVIDEHLSDMNTLVPSEAQAQLR